MTISNNPAFDPSKLGLEPPHSKGDAYANIVTRPGGPPLGEGDNEIRTGRKPVGTASTSIEDVIEQIKTIEANLPPELQGFNVGLNLQSARLLLQHQIDTLDPTNPTVPLLLTYVRLIQNLELASGDLVSALGTQGAQNLTQVQQVAQGDNANAPSGAAHRVSRVDNANAPSGAAHTSAAATNANPSTGAAQATASASSAAGGVRPSGGNPWLAGNAYVTFLVNYWEMLKALKEMKVVEGETQIVALDMMIELAKDTAEAIMDAAEARFWEHIAMAIVDAVSAGVTIGCSVLSVGATMKMKAESPDIDMNTNTLTTSKQVAVNNMRWQAVSQAIKGVGDASGYAGKSADNAIQAFQELKAAQKDALKETLQAYMRMQQTLSEKSQEFFRQNSELITALIQQIDQMRQKMLEAQAKALSRSG